MVDGAPRLRVRLRKPALPHRGRRPRRWKLHLCSSSLSNLCNSRSFLVHEVSAVGRTQADLPHEHAGIHKASGGALAAHAQAGPGSARPDAGQRLHRHRVRLGGALGLHLLGQRRGDLDVRGGSMLKAPLLGAELKAGRRRVGKRQRGESYLLVPRGHRAHVLQGDVHVLPGHGAPAHDKLLDLVTGRLRR